VSHPVEPFLPATAGDFSNNVTLPQLGELAICLVCDKKPTSQVQQRVQSPSRAEG
jgi:hypothetical protein